MFGASSDLSVHKFGKNDAGKGQNTNTLACGQNICMKKGGLMFEYPMHNFDVAPVAQSARYCLPPSCWQEGNPKL